MRKIIIATHGDFASGIKNSLTMIAGDLANDIKIYCLYPGASATEFADELRIEIIENSEVEYIILTDLFGASVCTAMSLLTIYTNVVVLAGLNLNIALEVLLGKSTKLTSDDIDDLLQSAKDGIQQIKLNTEIIEEDF